MTMPTAGGDRPQMVAGPPLSQDGRLAHRSIGAHDTGERIKSVLIYEKDALPPGLHLL
jgi:hypothetical protein